MFRLLLASVPLVATALCYLLTAQLPFFSESYMHTAASATMHGIADVFDTTRIPLRPGQHAWFWAMHSMWPVEPAWARLAPFLVHALTCAMTGVLARQLGASPRTAVLCSAAFALFPNVKSVAYVAAVGWPFRVLAMQLALSAAIAHASRPRVRTGGAMLAAFAVALACNQGSVVFPAMAGLLLLGIHGRSALARLRDPWVFACIVVATIYVVLLTSLERGPHHAVAAGALAANAAKASLCLAPEAVRVPLLDALRTGGSGVLLGVTVLLLLAAACGAWLWRTTPTVRALLIAIPIEWAPAMIVTGFAQRYAYLSASLLCISLALSYERTTRCRRLVAVGCVGLAGWWAFDTAVDVIEHREAGTIVNRVLNAAEQARSRSAKGTITLVSPPRRAGSEGDLPVLDFGLREALALTGVPGAFEVLITRGPSWSSAAPTTEPHDALVARLRAGSASYVVFDANNGRVVEQR